MASTEWKKIVVSLLLCGGMGLSPAVWAAHHNIHVDIPVKLKPVKVVFNMAHDTFAGDVPVGMHYMEVLAKRLKKDHVKGKIIGVFHFQAAYMNLNDKTYNAVRHVKTGNPYKSIVADLMKKGVGIEECVNSMKAHHWTNGNLLPGVKVVDGAVPRLIQLQQEGYAVIEP